MILAGVVSADEADQVRFRELMAKAEKGDPQAQHDLGHMYIDGEGVEKDPAEGIKWYRKAAELGEPRAQLEMARMYLHGRGVGGINYAEALRLCRKAADQNFAEAQNQLGEMYCEGNGVKQDYAEAAKWYRGAAEQNLASAQYKLAGLYSAGAGVEKDHAEAMKWMRKAAEQDHEIAQYCLATVYYKGTGVEKDYAEAGKWYRKAAERNHGGACFGLAQMYHAGEGVEKSLPAAASWYRKAAEKHIAPAQYELACLYYTGEGVGKNYAEAAKWFGAAAGWWNYPEAQRRLAEMLHEGIGVETNRVQAAMLLQKAADQGDTVAKTRLKEWYPQPVGEGNRPGVKGTPSNGDGVSLLSVMEGIPCRNVKVLSPALTFRDARVLVGTNYSFLLNNENATNPAFPGEKLPNQRIQGTFNDAGPHLFVAFRLAPGPGPGPGGTSFPFSGDRMIRMMDASGNLVNAPGITSGISGSHAFYPMSSTGGVFRMQCRPAYYRDKNRDLNRTERETPVSVVPWTDVLEVKWEP